MTGGKRPSCRYKLVTVVAAALFAICACNGGDAVTSTRLSPARTQVNAGRTQSVAAVRAYVDPETGELSAPPAPLQRGGAASAGPVPQLAVEPGTTAAGGVKVDLRGAFSYGLRATITEEGRVAAHCDHDDGAAPK